MAQSLICPFWVSEHRVRRDDAGRLHQIDYQVTEIRVTNPTDVEGRLDLVFYEARGDGNFYRADWASGAWTAPPTYLRYYRPDPSRVYGDSFYTYGWFEVWMSKDEMVIDVAISGTSRSLVSGGAVSGAGGVVESISQRTVHLVPKRVSVFVRIPQLFGRDPGSPFTFPPGTGPVTDDMIEEPFRPRDPLGP